MTADILIKLFVVAGVIALMLAMGLNVGLGQAIHAARQVRLLLWAILANFVAVPTATIVWLWCFGADPMVAIGFMTLAVCPGAPIGPPLTAIARGDVSIAVGEMVVLCGLSALLSPALLLFFSRQLLPDENLNIQYQTIVVTLVGTQLAPLTIGLVIRQLATVRAQRVARIVGPIGNALLLVAIVLVLVNEFETLKVIRLSSWMGMLTLLAASLAIGWFCGGPDRATRKALAVTTTARNAAVALVIVSASFAGTSAVCAVVAFGLVSIVGTLIGAWLLRCVGPALPLGRQPSAPEADVLSD